MVIHHHSSPQGAVDEDSDEGQDSILVSGSFEALFKQDLERAAAEIAVNAYLDPISYDAAAIIVAKQIRENGSVPSALRFWVTDVLTGTIRRPSVKGKVAGATVARDKLIHSLLRDLIASLGLKPTSSDRERGQSACHAVATGFALLGLEPKSYQAIEKIWENKALREYNSSDD